MNNGDTVFIVDSDLESRKKACGVVRSMKLHCEPYTLAQDFLEAHDPQRSGCVILEVRLPDVSGLQLQYELAQQTPAIPVIFLASHASVPVVVRAIQQGAVNFLQKPAEEQELWDTIQRALQIDRERRAAVAESEILRKQLELLTEKEFAVLALMAQEKGTRTIARELDVSVRTVEFRRCRMLQKLELQSPMQLLHFSIRACHQRRQNGGGKVSSIVNGSVRQAVSIS
jgi:two-component system, LuxR family, response regulator FixJ